MYFFSYLRGTRLVGTRGRRGGRGKNEKHPQEYPRLGLKEGKGN